MKQPIVPSPKRVVVTVDVEDWPQSTWDRSLPISERSRRSTEELLALLDGANVHATFFVLGLFAERFPQTVRAIHAAGHEVASHGHGHVEIFRQSRQEFRADLIRSKGFLEDLLGLPIRGYRAPDFSVIPGTLWALAEIADLGFTYDSSIFPIRRSRYGVPGWWAEPLSLDLQRGASIVELPPATVRVLGREWPVAGGGYFRLLPGAIVRGIARRTAREHPFVLYCHPYELDPMELSELPFDVPLSVRLHQGLGRGRFRKRLERFIREFRGGSVCELIDEPGWRCVRARLDTTETGGWRLVEVSR